MKLYIGFERDANARTVNVPLNGLLTEHPEAQPSLMYTRPGETTPYLVEQTAVSGDSLLWTVSATDAELDGRGWAQVVVSSTDGTMRAHGELMPVIVNASLPDAGTTPTVEETWEAEAARINALYQQILADYNSGAFKGEKGDTGAAGTDGADGYSPTVSITEGTGERTVTITDKDGVHSTTIKDGAKGDPGDPGSDADVTAANIQSALGYTPASTSVTDALQNDITNLDAKKVGYSQVVNNQLLMYSDSTKTTLLAMLDLPGGGVTDVQVNGSTVVTDGIANIPTAVSGSTIKTGAKLGVVAVNSNSFLLSQTGENAGLLSIADPSESAINNRYPNRAVTAKMLDYSIKSAMCDGVGAAWTADEQAAARTRMGITASGDTSYEIILDKVLSQDSNVVETIDITDYKRVLCYVVLVAGESTPSATVIYPFLQGVSRDASIYKNNTFHDFYPGAATDAYIYAAYDISDNLTMYSQGYTNKSTDKKITEYISMVPAKITSFRISRSACAAGTEILVVGRK